MPVIGLDIGGTKLAAGIIAADGGVLLRRELPTQAGEGGAAVLRRAQSLVQELLDQSLWHNIEAVEAIGVASAGQIDAERGVVLLASNLPGWSGTNIKQAFEERFALPCQVDNDVNAFVMGEARFGAGRHYQDLLVVAAGTGLGGGLLSKGQLIRGAHHCAGEIGHTLFVYNGLPCHCGRRGCLEQYSASAAIVRYFGDAAGAATAERPTIRQLAEWAAGHEDHPAALAFAAAGLHLGDGLAGLVRITDPQAIVLGGGLMAASPYYGQAARAAFARSAWPELAPIPLLEAALGPQAVLVGAAALVLAG